MTAEFGHQVRGTMIKLKHHSVVCWFFGLVEEIFKV